jgi:hypothetical protein
MRRPQSLPRSLRDRPFSVAEALNAGLRPGRLRAADLQKPIWGVRVPHSDDPTFQHLVGAASQVIGPDTAFSHTTAARLMGLPLPTRWRADEPVHVTRHTGKPRVRRSGVVAHRGLEHRDVTWVRGMPCVDPANTWADLATSLALDDLIVLGDAVAHWQRGIPRQELQLVIDDRVGCRGVERMRAALPLVRRRSESPMETRARLVFIRGGLPEPELNHPVHDLAGEWIATGDFVWRERRVVAEFDGDHHRTGRRQWQIDVSRRELVQDNGWHYVQLTAWSVSTPEGVRRTLGRLARLLAVALS